MATVSTDTIAAIATPVGRGGVGIIRISGSHVPSIATSLLGQLPTPRQAVVRAFRHENGEVLDTGVALYFKNPHSFTGEDVLELQCHGSPIVLDHLLNAILKLGARLARPGEFSLRAFLNDKIDLTQAEAIADLIDASSIQAALSASRSLQGVFSQQINSLAQRMLELRIYVEAAIDFPEEEVDFLSEGKIQEKIEAILSQLKTLQENATQGRLLREGLTVVIAGLPNAGKSSLLNCLTQNESAIVTAIPGTTRDLIKETIQIDGLPIHLLDTAGIRLNADVVEKEGILRSQKQQELADRILLVRDCTQPISEIEKDILEKYSHKVTQVFNKIDLADLTPGEREEHIYLSAKNGQGIEFLREHIKKCVGFQESEAGQFIARRRHLEALENTYHHCQQACEQAARRAGELIAHELRLAHDALGEIVGKVTSDDLLGNIFANFCIGK